ncbi:redox-sensitive transcriptional activator SoxR [Aureimonas altamirensis]|uniref:redox-sensitive transcriptional activator SoxR n=1 Tax=Aureimonas altamirensis TaxID=370622 RepID=UPI001E41BE9F|nr:redox-sensitive transcriptional activator SoxR [Aureimonas altamirensis]UHD45967.1 redox-sensitive transcriptional activator SoxR [Aureimonas altamirensis]
MSVAGLSVGEVAARSGVAVSTIHFYEAKGLIGGWRTQGNQRRYDRSVLRTIAIVQVAQRAGLPLKIVGEFLAAVPAGQKVDKDAWRAIAQSWQNMLDERIRLMTRLRDELGGCIGCGCLSQQDCPLRNPDDRMGREGPGARLLIR